MLRAVSLHAGGSRPLSLTQGQGGLSQVCAFLVDRGAHGGSGWILTPQPQLSQEGPPLPFPHQQAATRSFTPPLGSGSQMLR